jgi:hypothetical protein
MAPSRAPTCSGMVAVRDPDEIERSTAYQAVLSDLGLLDQEDSFTLLVARRIIDLAAEGERDPDRLRATALASLTKRPPANPFGREATESRRR